MDFSVLHQHTVSMDDFPLKFMFTEAIPPAQQQALRPLGTQAARWLWDYIDAIELHEDVPFKKGFFKTIARAKILPANEAVVEEWLRQCDLPLERAVFLSWQPKVAMIAPWGLVAKYWFCFSQTADLTVIDQSLQWALLFYHEDELYFGTNGKSPRDEIFADFQFSW